MELDGVIGRRLRYRPWKTDFLHWELQNYTELSFFNAALLDGEDGALLIQKIETRNQRL